jgi:two-component system chemotaxis response regulator CheY
MLAELNRASREEALIATILVDADNFNGINEAHGVMAGDLVLVEFAKRLRDCCREYDKLGRYGGEEFLVLLPRTTRDGAIRVAERIRQSIRKTPVEFLGNRIELTASVGIYTFSFAGEMKGRKVNERMLDEIIKKTNQALSVAKREGKNRVVIYNPS